MLRFYEEQGETEYSLETTKAYLLEKRELYDNGEIVYITFSYFRKFCDMADRYYLTGEIIRKQLLPPARREPSAKWGELIENFVASCEAENYAKSTTNSFRLSMRKFLLHCDDISIIDLSCLTHQNISEYIMRMAEKRMKTIRQEVILLRKVLTFLASCNLINPAICDAAQLKIPAYERVLHGFTEQESAAMIAETDANNHLGRRDYAIMLLAKTTGLRASDIKSLRLSDINWRTSEIGLVQSKTGNRITVPMLGTVGNAIADYILRSRPESDSDYVFLRAVHPHEQMLDPLDIIQKYAIKAGVEPRDERPIGYHGFRRQRGVSLLESEISVSTIREILGHADPNSVRRYIGLDITHLLICAMPMAQYKPGRRRPL